MDPNATIAELLDGMIPPSPSRARELGDALVGWVNGGGFIPRGWSRWDVNLVAYDARRCVRARDVVRMRKFYAERRASMAAGGAR